MERQKKQDESKKELVDTYREVRLAIESILRESLDEKNAHIRALVEFLEERNARIRALEEEIRALRGVVSTTHLDPRFWIGFPIGLFDEPWGCGQPEKRRKGR